MITSTEDLEQLRALNLRFIHNFVTNDVASHNAILHPEFRNISATGARIGRDAYLACWATGFDPEVFVYWDMPRSWSSTSAANVRSSIDPSRR